MLFQGSGESPLLHGLLCSLLLFKQAAIFFTQSCLTLGCCYSRTNSTRASNGQYSCISLFIHAYISIVIPPPQRVTPVFSSSIASPFKWTNQYLPQHGPRYTQCPSSTPNLIDFSRLPPKHAPTMTSPQIPLPLAIYKPWIWSCFILVLSLFYLNTHRTAHHTTLILLALAACALFSSTQHRCTSNVSLISHNILL